ncbi:MAG: Hsp20/alpha crystallin family protein [Chloroflexi bacterium]|nr:Hsp20/alpha crystallin family protein [Chloroflexota bacterium]
MALERWRQRAASISWRQEVEDMERRFEELLGRPMWPVRRAIESERGWLPAIDVYEKDDRLVVKAELPGIKEEDIDISISDSELTIRGERKTETEVKEENYYRSERSYGSFFRSIPLPSTVDSDKVEANYDKGILEITMPKMAAEKAKKIKVSKKK